MTCDAENVLGEIAHEALSRKLEVQKTDVRTWYTTSSPSLSSQGG